MNCDRCGKEYSTGLHCKLICDGCGGRIDCSDLHSLYTCKHFDLPMFQPCQYCENYEKCAWHEGDLKF